MRNTRMKRSFLRCEDEILYILVTVGFTRLADL